MNTVNYVKVIFCMMTWVMLIFGSLINAFEKYLPSFLKQAFYYGKFAYEEKTELVTKLEVPKKWFKHFYVYSSILFVIVLLYTTQLYYFQTVPPIWMEYALDNIGGVYRVAAVSPAHVLLALSLLTIHCIHRCYETQFVSVFGKNSRINLAQYMIGFIHYTGAALAILIEAPIYATTFKHLDVQLSDLKTNDYFATSLFLWACYHQYKTAVILADLRKNKKGRVVSDSYNVPEGDWFKYLSAPHMIAEILMYLSLTIILWGNITWLFIFVWVLSNQVETALLSHWWYQKTFKNYPPQRKALIPFVY